MSYQTAGSANISVGVLGLVLGVDRKRFGRAHVRFTNVGPLKREACMTQEAKAKQPYNIAINAEIVLAKNNVFSRTNAPHLCQPGQPQA